MGGHASGQQWAVHAATAEAAADLGISVQEASVMIGDGSIAIVEGPTPIGPGIQSFDIPVSLGARIRAWWQWKANKTMIVVVIAIAGACMALAYYVIRGRNYR